MPTATSTESQDERRKRLAREKQARYRAKNPHPGPLSVPSEPCPDCGKPKIKKAKRCGVCHRAASKGIYRTPHPLTESSARRRARELCPPGLCTYDGCTADGAQVHHIDGDPFNNDLSNLTRLCVRHHMTVDGRLEKARERAARVGREFGGRRKALGSNT